MEANEWCDRVAVLVVDALVDRGLVKPDDLRTAVAVASEEIYVRLELGDYPPPMGTT